MEARYKLFIVDDEPETREGLRYYVNWQKHGIEVIGEAEDGMSAYEEIIRLKPDIVMTDVRMPVMDGIRLAAKIRENDQQTKIIFVSSYDDTAYIRSALKVEAVDYILKPVDLKELDNVMTKLMNALNHDNSVRNRLIDLNVKITQSIPVLREKFFIILIRDDYDEDHIKERLEFLGIDLPPEAYYCGLAINVDDKANVFGGVSQRDKEIISFSIINICEEILNSYSHAYVFENREGEYVSIIRCEEHLDAAEHDNFINCLTQLKNNLLKFIDISVTIGVGSFEAGLKNVKASYEKAYENAEQKLVMGKNKIISVDILDKGIYSQPKLIQYIMRFVELIRAGNEEQIKLVSDSYFSELAGIKGLRIEYCRNMFLQVILTVYMQFMDMNMEDAQIDWSGTYNKLLKLETLVEMHSFIEQYLISASKMVFEKRNRKGLQIIKKVTGFINENYMNSISISDVAASVYLSKNYLCGLFHQETGQTINEYITNVRIGEAKKLLTDAKNKHYDICYMVGYTDPAYFSKVFKKATGVNPSEYREMMS